MLMEQEH